jgi:hypothetical protein
MHLLQLPCQALGIRDIYLVGGCPVGMCRNMSYGRAALGPKLLRAEIAAEVAALGP